MDNGGPRPSVQGLLSKGKPDHQNGGGKSETYPCSESSAPPAAQPSQRKCHLAAGRPRQRLSHGDDFCVGFLGTPSPPFHQFGAKVSQVSDGSTERCATQAEEDTQLFQAGLIVHSRTAT